MTDAEKGLAVWQLAVSSRHEDAPPNEYLHSEGNGHDVTRMLSVYSCNTRCSAWATITQLARHVDLETGGYGIAAHSVPEVYCDGARGMLEAPLIAGFPQADMLTAPQSAEANVLLRAA